MTDEATQATEENVPEGTDAAAETPAPPSAGGADEAAADGALPSEELNAMRDRHLRLAAEFDNYRKRVERERADSWVRAQSQLVEKLLEPLDDLQRIAHFDATTTSAAALLEGAQMVERKLMRAMEAAGLELIEAEGQPFDPMIHEALTTVATDVREEDDSVADVFQNGYRFKGSLVRPARVRVKKYQG